VEACRKQPVFQDIVLVPILKINFVTHCS
jgi:hypothetical protein